jgi:hypothetical protein
MKFIQFQKFRHSRINSRLAKLKYFFKKDISNTSNVIKLVQEKLNNCTESLASLRQVTSELNSDYKNLETQMDNLGCSVKEISLCDRYNAHNNNKTSMSRTSSLSSFVDNLSEQESTEAECSSSSSEVESEYDDLDSTYIFVRGNADGTASEEELERSSRNSTWRMRKRASIGTASNSSADSYDSYGNSSDGSSSSGGIYHSPANCLHENDRIIRNLLKSTGTTSLL